MHARLAMYVDESRRGEAQRPPLAQRYLDF